MIPMLLRLDIREHDRTKARFWFPVILVWIIVFALLIAALPFLLIAALATAVEGPGRRLLLLYPLVFGTINALSGLRIDVESRGNEKVFISLD
jgi:hypothetical protein